LDERNQLARDLHDGQTAAAARLQISAAELMIHTDPTANANGIAASQAADHPGTARTINIILELRPAALGQQELSSTAATYQTSGVNRPILQSRAA
jgi:signal transduction histidine kinase